MPKSIAIISYSNIASDSRVLRQIKYLSKDYSIIVIGHGKPHPDFPSSPALKWFEVTEKQKTIRGKAATAGRLLRYLSGQVDRPEVLKIAIDCKADAYLANNWDALPVAAQAAQSNRAALVLDIHESLSTSGGRVHDLLNRLVVKKYAGQINRSTTVATAIVRDYQRTFGFSPTVLMNVPPPSAVDIPETKTDPLKIRLVHHGLALPSRQPDLMIRALALAEPRYELHLIYPNHDSAFVQTLKQFAEETAPGRVFFHPPLPSLEIVPGIAPYDIGFYPLPSKIYNHQIALPNKFFEFIAAGLAVCIGPSPSMAEIVRKYRCGVISDSFKPEDIAQTLNRVTAAQWDEMRSASREAAKVLNADVEMQKLIELFEGLFSKQPA